MVAISARTKELRRLVALCGLLALLAACATNPPAEKTVAPAPVCSRSSPLGELAAFAPGADPAHSGILLLDTGRDAFLARAALIEAATCSIDAQYYIWNGDASGRYLAGRLLAAADRGVKVRLLLDDINVGGREGALAALAAHPNIEVQVYNPFEQRDGLRKAFNFLWEFTRLNRRMHVKSFTVDQSVTILGGRNIGDEYFDANAHLNFRDRDVLATGPVVAQTVVMFQQFWEWPLSRPVAEIAGAVTPPEAALVRAQLAEAGRYLRELHGPLPADAPAALGELRREFAGLVTAPARLIHDPPPNPEALGDSDQPQAGSRELREIASAAQSDILVESAYLVLDDETVVKVRALRDRGITVRALTNSLASNDVTANHAAYARRREDMLASGIELYELRPDAASCAQLIRKDDACGAGHIFGLHAKTYVVDRRLLYIGSLNMNLRSRFLNAESGLLIDDPGLAQRVVADIEQNMAPANSWQPLLDERGRLYWLQRGDDGEVDIVYDHEPQVPWSRRTRSAVIARLPLEKYL